MRIFYFSCDFLYTAVRTWITFQLLEKLFPQKRDEKVAKWIQVIVTIVVSGLNTYNDTLVAQQFSNNMMILLVVIVSLFAKQLYRGKYKEIFCITGLFWTLLALVDFFIQSFIYKILSEVGEITNILVTASEYRGCYLLICATLIGYVGWNLKKWIQKNNFKIEKYEGYGWIIFILLTVCMVYFQRIYKSIFTEDMMNHWWIFILGTCVGILVFLIYQVKRKHEEQIKIQELKITMLESSYKKLQDVYDEKAILLHDMKNHMQIIKEMVRENKNQETLNYIQELLHTFRKRGSHIYTENEQLDLILNVKMQEAQDVGIYIIQKCGNMRGLKLTFTELCALFGNIMDNAIEANQKLQDRDKKRIEISCERKGRLLLVSSTNPIVEAIDIVEGILPRTTKENTTEHGIGMQSIKKVVDAHDGSMNIEMKDGILQLNLYVNGFEE